MTSTPIDVVYTWVDGHDPKWQALKRSYMGAAQRAARPDDEQWGDDTRYRHMEEIVYAVRSARRYAPWIGTIYIVITDGQVLPAVVREAPGVVVVPYSTIMPAEILPSFCSNSIEAYLHQIPGLSEIFLYGNDDYLFWKPTPPTYFVRDGELVLRGYHQPQVLARIGLLRKGHMKLANRTAMLLYARGFDRVYMPEHAYHVMRKSTCAHVWAELHDELTAATALKFRDDTRAFWWQLLVYSYEDQLHAPIHELALGGDHLSFADVERSRIISAYVRARLVMLSRFPSHTVCFNTIPASWHEAMHQYFALHLGDEQPSMAAVAQLVRAAGSAPPAAS
jgi:hypothetical protein